VARLSTQHLGSSLVPDDHRTGSAHVILVHAFELASGHLVVVDRHREPADSRIERRALGHGPRAQHACIFDAEVEVERRRVVKLNDEASGHPTTVQRVVGNTASRMGANKTTTNGPKVNKVNSLGILGLVEAVQYLRTGHSGQSGAVTYAALGGSLVLAAAFGGIRAATVRVWIKDGVAWSQGNWLTAVLWIIALAAHLGYDYLVAPGHGNKSVGASTALLYVAFSLGIQRVVVQFRARRLQPDLSSGGLGSISGVS
jgi:hypothetical protein